METIYVKFPQVYATFIPTTRLEISFLRDKLDHLLSSVISKVLFFRVNSVQNTDMREPG